MKQLCQRELDELKLDHKNTLDSFKSSCVSKMPTQNNEHTKINGQSQLTDSKLDMLRNEKKINKMKKILI